ncbi:hypothetical protein HHL22_14745 [Hymenobacter sp. RP-2-7]|uniref:DUF6630 domain-containing protein n=1 Tax=Hymenobacter polaris TaxID=2682546 RepID=A0A7Y0FND6_9BACT|nr:hypothetical protein [Hymenobacter polaris]NML66466.1 hypothetical protein [Hymenobacter polaris]
MDSLTQFLQLFTLGDHAAAARLEPRLALVLADPAAYHAQFGEELLERGIEGDLPVQELRDVAMIDALLSEELVWEADWQDAANYLAGGLDEILTRQQRAGRLGEQALGARRLVGPDALDALQDALEPLGLALVLFTLDSDSYALSVVADGQAEDTRQLAAALGFTLAVY